MRVHKRSNYQCAKGQIHLQGKVENGFIDSSHSNARSIVSHNSVSSNVVVESSVSSGTVLNAFTEEIVAYEKEIDETYAVKSTDSEYFVFVFELSVRIFRPFSKDILSFHDSSLELLCFPVFMSFAMILYMFDFKTYSIARAIYTHDHDLHDLPPSHGGTMTVTHEAPVFKVRIFRPFSKDILSFHDSSPELLCFPIFMSFAMILYMFDFKTYSIARAIYTHDHDLHDLPPSHGGTMTVTHEAPVGVWVHPSLHVYTFMVIGWCVLYIPSHWS
ncbi:hypothetical protein Tco_0800874 [Tanacetum coccineum]|uniref:Uncharacterized protein n=1 Tax=Tanacetum coccineum TaxID=301880 RepID=A0ABQ4ZX95_9ASTR